MGNVIPSNGGATKRWKNYSIPGSILAYQMRPQVISSYKQVGNLGVGGRILVSANVNDTKNTRQICSL